MSEATEFQEDTSISLIVTISSPTHKTLVKELPGFTSCTKAAMYLTLSSCFIIMFKSPLIVEA